MKYIIIFSLFLFPLLANAYTIKNQSNDTYQMSFSKDPQDIFTLDGGDTIDIDNENDALFIVRGAAHDFVNAKNANYVVGPSTEITSSQGVKYINGEFEVLIGANIYMENKKTTFKIENSGYIFYQFNNSAGEVIVTGQVPPFVRPLKTNILKTN
ncbi:hypothetical protein BTN33_21910 [Aeromonas veronii]|uniref:hypothetical protein n=1 Tax=Aeromonas veronii TaxID=654 RepID=UPI000946E81D|nr:hypothetical protein [Aeromonas veronii]OLF57012.1 hypothetical protein BTN33_21910 [Aeromonas veronii]